MRALRVMGYVDRGEQILQDADSYFAAARLRAREMVARDDSRAVARAAQAAGVTTVLALCWGGCGHRAWVPRELAARGWRCLRC